MSKVWFITGAGSGLGKGIARAALREGDQVVATGRNLDNTFSFPSEFQTFAVTTPTPALQSDGKVILAGVMNTIARNEKALFPDGSIQQFRVVGF